MDKPTCSTCVYWQMVTKVVVQDGLMDNSTGQCRRHAPQAANGNRWPSTSAYDWCGEADSFIKWMLDRPRPSKEATPCSSDSSVAPTTTAS